jgi:hypothetical protein
LKKKNWRHFFEENQGELKQLFANPLSFSVWVCLNFPETLSPHDDCLGVIVGERRKDLKKKGVVLD